ncbi:MAG TPA: hypothetical protein VFP72_17205 [Kineosporiaceae bacterium]|nr:hypothetical protein [Kineosporiaceae bacterium]
MDIGELSDAVERISRNYAQRFGITRDTDWFLLKLQEEVGELTQAHLMRQGQARTKGRTPEELTIRFADEVADVLGQVLLLARHHEIDLVAAMERKWLVWAEKTPTPWPSHPPVTTGTPASRA